MSFKRALSRITQRSDEDYSSVKNSLSPSPHRSILNTFLRERERDYVSSSDDLSEDSSAGALSKNRQKRLVRQHRRRERSRLSEEQRLEESSVRRKNDELARVSLEEAEEMKVRYGDLPLVQSRDRPREHFYSFEDVSLSTADKRIVFTARLHIVRKMSSKFVFLIFRQQLSTFQGVLHEKAGSVSTIMIRWAERLRLDDIVRVRGTVRATKAPVLGCTIRDVELSIDEIHLVMRRDAATPFGIHEAEVRAVEDDQTEGRLSRIHDRTRLANRILDLRTPTAQSIFRIQSCVSSSFRSSLDERGFIEIHTPKLQGSATESGASVFEVNYFSREAFLAQSPQLAKQMAIIADFGRVYEIGAVFRAENSNTHRHLTEYTGLDLEMVINEHYHEMVEVLDNTIKAILQNVYSRYRREVEVVKHQFPSEDVVWLEETPIIRFTDGIKLLNDSGWRGEDDKPLSDNEDLGTRDEVRLGELVKEKYGTDYYILDRFPVSARPFYTMPDPEDERFTNSFDMFIRGQEIVSGGQRIHDSKMLEENMLAKGVNPDSMAEYTEGFRWGAPPHAGAGIGLERLLMLILKLGNIRLASLFYRDPKSFPSKPPILQLRHPESSTVEPSWLRDGRGRLAESHSDLQPLDHLIANYGDATSTSFFDERFKLWRDMATGAAVAYVLGTGNYAIIAGNPLCDTSQYYSIVTQFLQWMRRETKRKPIWIICSPEIEEILGAKLGWRTFSNIADERVDPSHNQAASDGEIARKIRHAEAEGVRIITLNQGEAMPEDIRQKVDQRIQDWLSSRKGAQVHLSEIHPWRDHQHRWYFYAVDREHRICALVVLATLSPANGMQIKYSFDFPGAPNGVIEFIVSHAIQSAARTGVKSFTFGAGATTELIAGHNIHGAKAKMLQHTYETLAKQFHLVRKSEFRGKLGAHDSPLYIAYPPHGLGSKGIRAILNFFED